MGRSDECTRTILALMAHPDDAEILAGGLLVHLARRGWQVHIASATPGDCGTTSLGPEEIAAIRREEARAAAERLGGTYHCLELRDLQVVYGPESVARATGVLRRVRPGVVVTHSPEDYMADHEETSRIARAACFNAPIPNAPAPLRSEPIPRVPYLYYADPVEGKGIFGQEIPPRLVIDLSGVLEEKLALVACHASQREWLRAHHGMDEYIESVKRWNRERGRAYGLAYAEGYRQHLGHAYPGGDILLEELEGIAYRVDAAAGSRGGGPGRR